jgi:hypothetical protein
MGSYTLPPYALYKPNISETGWSALVDTNFDLLAANSNAQLALGMFDYLITYGDVGDGNGVQARAINLRTYSVVAQNANYATVHNALVDSFPSTGANVLVRSALPVVPLTTSLRFNKFVGGTWTITPGQWVFGGRSFRFQAQAGFASGPNGSIMMDLEAGGVNGVRGGKHILYGPFCDANNIASTCIVTLGKGTPAGSEGDDNWLIAPTCIKFTRSGISYGTPADAVATPPNGSSNCWTFAGSIGPASGSVGGFEFQVGDGQVLWCQVPKPGNSAYFCNALTTTIIGGHATLDSSVAGYIAEIAEGTNFSMDSVYFDNIAGSNLGAVGVRAVDPGIGAGGITLAAVRVRISNSHFNMNSAVPIMVIDNAAAVSGITSFTLRNANAPGQNGAHTSAIVHFKDLRGASSSINAAVSNAIAASTLIDGGVFTNTDNIYTISGTTDPAARPTIGRINMNGTDMSQVPIKMGVPVDADYTQAIDGLQVLDTTGGKMYVRVGGVWTALN